MKKYVYLMIDKNNNVVAAYENEKVAQALVDAVAKKLGTEIRIKQQILNSELSTIK